MINKENNKNQSQVPKNDNKFVDTARMDVQCHIVIKDKDTNLFNIEWKNVNKIIQRLSQLEHELLLKEYNVREKYDHWKWNDPKNDDDKEKTHCPEDQ
jgi:hypothetical protein